MSQKSQQKWPVARLLIIGILFHLIYIGTVFDCYFTSPVVHGMAAHNFSDGPAKRLVLIVGDGLRADFVFSANATTIVPDAPKIVAPFLRSVIEERGAWGVSHTRVPTESRPGHVALIAGMYEDVSAVTKGWKTNPVDFDSVFNRSSHTFSFGSPDILPMFERGAVPGRVKTWMYDEEAEDFTKDATALDVWVYDRLEELFHNATMDPVLDAQLRDSKVVFFLHLLGLDTTGHAYRPHSKEYMDNIVVVDEITRKTEKLFTDFYGDAKTSYVFTADHGMSRIGNHGDGDPDNTRTPLIAWGAGIRQPVMLHNPDPVDEYSAPWSLERITRRDVEQADIAALMSSLLGTSFPVNSVGVLPDINPQYPGYLDRDEADITRAGLINAKAILEHYRVKHELKQQYALHYTPFPDIDHHDPSGFPAFNHIEDITALVISHEYHAARTKLVDLIGMALQGLRYLETYDRTFIQVLVAFAYVGWMAFCAIALLAPSNPPSKSSLSVSRSLSLSALFVTILSVLWAMLAAQHSPWTLYVYAIFPVYFWHEVFCTLWQERGTLQIRASTGALLYTSATIPLTSGVIGCMVLAYTTREIWSVGFLAIGLIWPLTWRREVRATNKGLWAQWAVLCLLTAIFPVLSVSPAEHLATILVGGACMSAAGVFAIYQIPSLSRSPNKRADFQILLISLAMGVTTSSVQSLQAKRGLPIRTQLCGWLIFLAAPVLPFLPPSDSTVDTKLLTFFLTFCPCFVLLSIRAEGLFYVAYCATLWLWVRMETAARTPNPMVNTKGWNPGGLRADDVRIALFFLFFVQVGFFGTGNVASVSSFYLEPVYRLVPVFNPFLMATLLVFKILAPYVMLCACFALLNSRLRMPPFTFFLIALALTDGMTMTFFFRVTDTGSWLEIGQSISHFCITSLLLVFSAGIAALGDRLMAVKQGVSQVEQ